MADAELVPRIFEIIRQHSDGLQAQSECLELVKPILTASGISLSDQAVVSMGNVHSAGPAGGESYAMVHVEQSGQSTRYMLSGKNNVEKLETQNL